MSKNKINSNKQKKQKMKKITILSIMLAFVVSASAQFIQAPKGEMKKVSETGLNAISVKQLKQNKNLFEGWVFPADIAFNLNGGNEDFYGAYLQPLWPDSTVVTTTQGTAGTNYVWMHSAGFTFDARSLGLDENLQQAPATGAYKVDSVVIAAWYEYRNGKFDTLLIEVGAVNENDQVSLVGLQLGTPDTTLSPLKISSVAAQQYGVGTTWSNPNKTIFKYALSERDTSESDLKFIEIALPSEITVGVGQVLGINFTFIPGTEYQLDDTLRVFGADAVQSTKLNSFGMYYMGAEEAAGAAFFDPFGKNLYNFNHSYSRYQTWTNALLNQCLYPDAWGSAYIGFKVVEPQSIKKYGELKVNAYPNPANDILNVELNSNENAVISIVNLIGQTVKVVNTNNTLNTIQISDLTSGMYMLKVEQAGKTFTSKIVVK